MFPARIQSLTLLGIAAIALASAFSACSGASNNPAPTITHPPGTESPTSTPTPIAPTPTPTPTGGSPTPTPTPTATPTGGAVLIWNPPSVTLTKGSSGGGTQQSTIIYQSSPDENTNITGDTCSGKGIATIKYFDYGTYEIKAGKVNGNCTFTATDNSIPASGTLNVTNSFNAAAVRIQH